jgi:hypothetical protein
MPDSVLKVQSLDGKIKSIKLVDNGDGSYSVASSESGQAGAGTLADAADRTINSGGNAQDALAANPDRRYLFVMNPTDESEVLYVNIGDDAAADTTSWPLAAGGSLVFEGSFVPKGNVSVLAGTTGHAFICKEGT